jgi:cytochrome c-type biogenesis protein CcsB
MFDSIKKILFSTKLTAGLLIVFAVAIGAATFIENDYGTSAAKALVFNTKWLELILILLTVNLIGNIFKYKLFRLEKLATLTFHVALIIILIGAGITRYIGFEGSMHIREGATSNTIVSDDTYLKFKVDDQKVQYTFDKVLFLNPLSNKAFNHQFEFANQPINITYKNFIPNSIDTVITDNNGKNIIEIITVGQGGRVSRYIESGKTKFFGQIPVAFNNTDRTEAVKILETDSGLMVLSPYEINYMSMDDQSRGVIVPDSVQPFKNRRLHSIGEVQMVLKTIHHNSIIKKISAPKNVANGEDALVVDVTCGDVHKEVTLFGGKGYISNNTIFQLKGLNFSLAYGSKSIATPFSVRLDKFILDKYPGSMSPSSYESEVTVIDNRNGGKEFSQRIYMNHVLDYDGYRLFQSSYDQDEKGTVLSVNHDYWGTMVTYLGYFLMTIGMAFTLVMRKSRFNELRKKIKKMRAQRTVVIALFLMSGWTTNQIMAQHENHNHGNEQKINYYEIDLAHAEKFEKLLVQDRGGRIKPMQTLASELARKITRKEEFNGLNSSQLFLSMIYNPGYWQTIKMIKVSHPELEEKLGAENHYVAFLDFFDKDFNYILNEDVQKANRKKPSEQTKYDKEVLKVDERTNICFMIYQGTLLRIFPKANDKNNTWYSPNDYQQFTTHDSTFVKSILSYYFMSINESFSKNEWSLADSTLTYLTDYQAKFGAAVIPEQRKIDMEITYNKVNIFKKLFIYYSMVGLFLLIFIFAEIFTTAKWIKYVIQFFTIVLFVLFTAHTVGLAMRWYISGHAPWSNGYESMIYIAWTTILAGFIFSRTSKMTLAATAILTSLILMVAHLNWLDPEITPLVPVLKSYWLMIHVAVITGSYGFLGLGALLGFMNLILMIVKNAKNKIKVNNTIKELTHINEMTLTVGLFMAAVGTFLGGIWANESWGRYWGWDPKETWALVIVLVYAMILHLRFIPKLNGKYLFNLVSVLAFATVIMTYFGVNYYLSGLHSYAKGDPVPIPTFVYYTVAVIVITAILAYLKNRKLKG